MTSRVAALAVIVTLPFGMRALRAADSGTSLDTFMAQRGYAAVHLKFGEQSNHYLIRGKLNGQNTLFAVDTACSLTAVDRGRTKKMQIMERMQERLYGAFGPLGKDFKVVSMDKMELEGTTIANQTAVVLDLHRDCAVKTGSLIPRSDRKDAFDVLLGTDFLTDTYAFLSGRGPVLYVRAEQPSEQLRESIDQSLKASGFSCLRLSERPASHYYVEGEVNGHKAEFCLDSGAPFTQLDSNQLKELGVSRKEILGKVIDPAQNKEEFGHAKVASLKLGDWEIKDFRVGTVSLEQINEQHDTNGLSRLSGIIGPDILERSHALLDCAGRKLYVLPKK